MISEGSGQNGSVSKQARYIVMAYIVMAVWKQASSQLLLVSGSLKRLETGRKRTCQLRRLTPQSGLECRAVRCWHWAATASLGAVC